MDDMRETIGKIVSIEWEMFIAVNEGEERASCQEDRDTFTGMREAQYKAWTPVAVGAYLADLEDARKNGRNLVEEKYIHMMKTTEPARYESLLSRVTPPSDASRALAKDISDKLLDQTRVLFEDYPYVSGRGRPLYSELDYGNISVETYQLSELLTYSERTLEALKEHVLALEKDGKSLARIILENTVRFYGYDSLETAETATRERADELEIEVSFGCSDCEDCDL